MVETSRFAIEGVTVRNADAVLVSDLSLSVGSGEVLAITGPSGTGKSSLHPGPRGSGSALTPVACSTTSVRWRRATARQWG